MAMTLNAEDIAAIAQAVARERYGASGAVYHVAYNAGETMGNDGLSWATADLTAGPGVRADIVAALAGDLVCLGAGQFDLGSQKTPIFTSQIPVPTGVRIDGAGRDQTIVTSDGIGAAVFRLTANCKLSNLTAYGRLLDGSYQYPVYFYSGTNIVIEDIRMIGDTDGVISNLSNDTSRTRMTRCVVDAKYDAINNVRGVIEIEDSVLRVTGPSSTGDGISHGLTLAQPTFTQYVPFAYCRNSSIIVCNGGGMTDGVAAHGGATVYLFNCDIVAKEDGSYGARGLFAEDAATIIMLGGSIRTSSGNATDLCASNAGTGKIVLIGVAYDRTKISNTGTGQIIDLPVVSDQVIRDAMKLAASTGDPAAGSIDAALDSILTGLEAAVEGTGMTLDTLLDTEAVDGKTLREVLQIISAILAGKVSGAGTGTETFKGLDGSTDRVRVVVNPIGNRTAITYDP